MTKDAVRNLYRAIHIPSSGPASVSKPRGFSKAKAEPSPNVKGVDRTIPSMCELIHTEKEVKNADREDIYSLATIMRACRKWKAFSEVSSEKEDDIALPYFRRFVRAMKSYISDSPKERAVPAMQDLAELMLINISSVSYALTELYGEPDEEVRKTAFSLLESNAYHLLRATNLYVPKQYTMIDQIGTILETYAGESYMSAETAITDHVNGDTRHPHPPNEEIASAISTFLFFQKEGLLRSTEGLELLPYALSWSSEHYDSDKIDFMIDSLSEIPRAFRKEILLKVVIFANSEPIRECALDLLIEMGVHNVKSESELGGMEDICLVNMLLKGKFSDYYGAFADEVVMPPNSALH